MSNYPLSIVAAMKDKSMSRQRAEILMTIVKEVIRSGRCCLVARAFVIPGNAQSYRRIRIVRRRLQHLAVNGWIKIIPSVDGGVPRELVPNLKRIADVPSETRAK